MIVKCVVVLNAPSYNVHSDKTSYFISHGHFWTAQGTTVNAPDIKKLWNRQTKSYLVLDKVGRSLDSSAEPKAWRPGWYTGSCHYTGEEV